MDVGYCGEEYIEYYDGFIMMKDKLQNRSVIFIVEEYLRID